jgi:hypothetical protein
VHALGPSAHHPLALKAWAERIALRRGKRIAVGALARRLAGILYTMWRNGTVFAAPQRPAPRGALGRVNERPAA